MNSEKLSTFVVQPCTEQHLFFCSENVNILEIKSCDLSQVNWQRNKACNNRQTEIFLEWHSESKCFLWGHW